MKWECTEVTSQLQRNDLLADGWESYAVTQHGGPTPGQGYYDPITWYLVWHLRRPAPVTKALGTVRRQKGYRIPKAERRKGKS